jgi:ATP-dependent protease ClpP protease subunit
VKRFVWLAGSLALIALAAAVAITTITAITVTAPRGLVPVGGDIPEAFRLLNMMRSLVPVLTTVCLGALVSIPFAFAARHQTRMKAGRPRRLGG